MLVGMMVAYANRQTYRIFNFRDKLIIEFEADILDEDLGTTDKITKQLVLTDDMQMPVEHLTDMAILKMAEYEQSFVSE